MWTLDTPYTVLGRCIVRSGHTFGASGPNAPKVCPDLRTEQLELVSSTQLNDVVEPSHIYLREMGLEWLRSKE